MGILKKMIKSTVYHEPVPIRRDVRFNLDSIYLQIVLQIGIHLQVQFLRHY